jgi:hypothetical protein
VWRKQGKVATRRSRLSDQDAGLESGAGVGRRTGLFLARHAFALGDLSEWRQSRAGQSGCSVG